MKIVVFSDSHGCTSVMEDIIIYENPDKVIHLGDTVTDADILKRVCFNYNICSIKGNNDYTFDVPEEIVIPCANNYIYVCHGHLVHVKKSLDFLASRAKSRNCGIALFGHTHIPCDKTINEIRLINPGSITFGKTYLVLNISELSFNAEIKKINDVI